MAGPTNKDAGVERWQLNDEVVRLRLWATDDSRALPQGLVGEVIIGSGETSWWRVQDERGRVSRKHATLIWKDGVWVLRDAGSTNGTMADRVRCTEVTLEPGMEIWLGGVVLVAESRRSIAVRAFLARLLGWSAEQMEKVELALQSIRIATQRRTALLLCGEDDLVAVAQALHRRVAGAERRFVVCDPHRQRTDENVRKAENYRRGMEALLAAKHGAVCVRSARPPNDFADMMAALANPDTGVQLIVCGTNPCDAEAYAVVPITVPAFRDRTGDIPRIVEEYAHDITADLGVPRRAFSRSDQQWVVEHGSQSLPEIEKVILRILQIREAKGNLQQAADRLGMGRWSLQKWIRRHNPPVPAATDEGE